RRRQAGQHLGGDPREQVVEDGPCRLQVEPFDVEQAAVAGLHDDGDPLAAGHLTDPDLHVDGVAFLDDHVEAGDERLQVVVVDSAREDLDRQVGVDLGDPPPGEHRLVEADVEDRGGYAVQVGELDVVEVGQAELTAEPTESEGGGDRVAGAQPDDADAQAPQGGLFGRGDPVPVPVEAEQGKGLGAGHAHHRLAPRVIDVPGGLFQHGRVG